jgi:FkbM family methyltransferase
VVRAGGYDLVPHLARRRSRAIAESGATIVLDVGANRGQFASELRADGYDGRIVSFEPLAGVFQELRDAAAGDSLWDVHRFALGEEDGTATIHRAADPTCSSLLTLAAQHGARNPGWRPVGDEAIEVRRLDSLLEVLPSDGALFLKLDVQGFELPALRGAEATMERVAGLEVELSLDATHAGQALLPQVATHLYERNFRIVWLERIFEDPSTRHLLQVDALFLRAATAAGGGPI